MEKINQTESWFFEKSNKIDTDEEKWENKQITNQNEKGAITIDHADTERV